jgi:hypothetical protein
MSTIDQIRVIDFTNGEPTIGMGFNSQTLQFPGTALTFARSEPDPHEDGQVVTARAVVINSHEELNEAIGTSFSASGRFGLASASAKVDFAKSTGFNSTSSFVLAKASVVNPITRGLNFQLTGPANNLLKAIDLKGFKAAFGDSFVRGIKSGGEFFAVFRLTSLKTTSQTSLAATLAAEINGLIASAEFQASFQQKQSDATDRAEVEVNFYQAAGSGATASVTLDVPSILERLKNFPKIAADHPMPYKVEIATYDTIPIPIPPPEEQEDFLLSLQLDDAKKLEYVRRRNDVDFALEHPEYFDGLPDRAQLQSQSEIYLRLLNGVMDHAVRLAKGQISPPQTFDPAKVGLTEPIPIQFKRKGLARLPFAPGDHVTMRCLGNIGNPNHVFLNGRTQDGVVDLAPSTDQPFTGTLWEAVSLADGFGFRCLGSFKNPDHVWLDGRTLDGSVGLAPSTDGIFTGTHWEVSQVSDGSCVFNCLGAIKNPNFLFLDGRTVPGSVGLAPNTNAPFTGAHWLPVVVPR